jgi:hypothetical protein
MIYNEPDWNYRIDRRHNSNNRSDRIWVREKSHPRSRRVRPVRLRGTVPGVRRVIPPTSLDVNIVCPGVFSYYLNNQKLFECLIKMNNIEEVILTMNYDQVIKIIHLAIILLNDYLYYM